MALTPRLHLQYPDENQNPFYTVISSFFDSMDSHLFANMADRNLFLRGGGVISFVASTSLVTWGSAFLVQDSVSGFHVSVVAGSLALLDGQMAVIDTDRVLSQNSTVTVAAVNTAGVGEGKIVLFYREGTKIVFRNGVIIQDGYSGKAVEFGSGGDVRKGTVTFPGGASFVAVIFSSVFADTNYRIVGLVPDFAKAVYAPVANKTVSGFRVTTVDGTNPSSGDKVDWKVEHA